MKNNELVQIKGLDIKELKDKAKALKSEIAKLTMEKNMNKLKDLKSISKKRKDLAQILTVIRQKQLLVELEPVIASVAKQSNPVKTPIKIATPAKGRTRNDKKRSKTK